MSRIDDFQRDLGVKLSIAIEELIERDMQAAERVLPPANRVMMLLNTAMGVTACAISIALQERKPGTDVEAMYDSIATRMAAQIFSHKAKVLDGVALIEAGRSDEALARYGSGRTV